MFTFDLCSGSLGTSIFDNSSSAASNTLSRIPFRLSFRFLWLNVKKTLTQFTLKIVAIRVSFNNLSLNGNPFIEIKPDSLPANTEVNRNYVIVKTVLNKSNMLMSEQGGKDEERIRVIWELPYPRWNAYYTAVRLRRNFWSSLKIRWWNSSFAGPKWKPC